MKKYYSENNVIKSIIYRTIWKLLTFHPSLIFINPLNPMLVFIFLRFIRISIGWIEITQRVSAHILHACIRDAMFKIWYDKIHQNHSNKLSVATKHWWVWLFGVWSQNKQNIGYNICMSTLWFKWLNIEKVIMKKIEDNKRKTMVRTVRKTQSECAYILLWL